MIVLPYPVSANRYWQTVARQQRGGRGVHVIAQTIVSEAGKEYRLRCAWYVQQIIRTPLKGPVIVAGHLYGARPQDWEKRARKDRNWFDNAQVIDTGNADKVVLDAMNGVAYEDDKQVRLLTMQRMEPDEHGARLELMVAEFNAENLERVTKMLAKQAVELAGVPVQQPLASAWDRPVSRRPRVAHRSPF